MTARARLRSAESSELCQPGDVFGRYEILFPIASGGMATVYAARMSGEGRFQKPVAIKLMLPHLTRDERFCSMFMDEATLAANIESPYVVRTLDLGREGEVLYMAMDLVLGATLRELQESGCLPPEVAAAVLVQTARGLHDAHQARSATGDLLRIVHRDVSPHNVLVGVDGRARLSDFGVARALHRHSHTETGELKGKLAYFSPEQLEARDDLDHRSDIFALGVVAWETFAGRRLFAAPNPLALAKQIATDRIPRLDEQVGLPTEIADVISRALERDRNERFSTAEAFGLELEHAASTSIGLASAGEIGATVRLHAGERVSSLERRIHRLMLESSNFQVTSPFDIIPALNATDALEPPRPARRRKVRVAIIAATLASTAIGLASFMLRDEGPSLEEVDAPSTIISTTEPPVPDPEPAIAPMAHDQPAPEVEPDAPPARPAPPSAQPRRAGPTRAPTASSAGSMEAEVSPEARRGGRVSERSSSMSVLRVELDRFESSLRSGDEQ